MSNTTRAARRLPTSQLLFGAVVVLIGVLLLLDTTGIYPTERLLLYVPTLFVLVGVWALLRSGLRSLVGPLVVIVVAAAWQLVALDVATADQLVAYWPVLVIAFGLSVVLGQYRSRARAADDAYSSVFAAFGGVERRIRSTAFEGADLTAVFGGAELDLRDVELAERPARVNAVALFGGVDVIVPRDWNVRMEVLPILGGAADDRPRREEQNEAVDLEVTGFAAFGGVSVSD
ncbi:MAG: LiaF-related protein [Halobacteriales archaeon]|nr:LiaF-related protein [Halobacteriales archaeon]